LWLFYRGVDPILGGCVNEDPGGKISGVAEAGGWLVAEFGVADLELGGEENDDDLEEPLELVRDDVVVSLGVGM